MTLLIRVVLVILTLSISGAFAQGNSDQNRSNREFLRPIFVVIYEVDEEKWIPPGDANVAGPDDSTEIGRMRA